MDDTTRDAVEMLEYMARRGELTQHESGAIFIVLSALAESDRLLTIYRADRRKWKEQTFWDRYSSGLPAGEVE